jgi:putative hydrolase of the HAD superfamily
MRGTSDCRWAGSYSDCDQGACRRPDGVLRTWEKRSFAVLEATYGLPNGSMAAVAFDAARLLPAITGSVSDDEWRAGVRAELVGR